VPAPTWHPPPCGSRSRLPRPCALAAVNELEQNALATPLELELGEPSELELETGECEPEPGEREPEPGAECEPEQGEPSARADSNGDERAVLLIINKRSTLVVRKREVSPQKNILAAAPTEHLRCISIFSTRMCDTGWSRIRSIVILFSTDERVLVRFEYVSGVRAGYHRRTRFVVYGSIITGTQ